MTTKDNDQETIDINIFSLNFTSRSLEKRFREVYYIKSLFAFRLAFIAVAILYLLFGYFDHSVSPEFGNQFIFIRLAIVIPLFLLTFLLSFTKFFNNIWQSFAALCLYIGGMGIIYMLVKAPDNMLYYGGLFLVFSAGFFLIKLRFLAATITSVAILISYNLCFALIDSSSSVSYLLMSNSFYLSSVIIGAFALYSYEYIERQSFYQEELLDLQKSKILDINFNLEKEVSKRTFELKQAIGQSKLIMKGSNIGWWDWDIPSGTESYNDILPKLLEFEHEDIKPQVNWLVSRIHPDDAEQALYFLQDHFEGKTEFFISEHRLQNKNGQWKWFSDYGKVVERDMDGKPIRMVGSLRDIDERKKWEVDLKRNNEELIFAKEKAQESDKLKSAFLSNMSPEIRTPLNAIMGFSNLLSEDDFKDKRDEFIDIIQKNGQQLTNIIGDILDISKIETKQVKIFNKQVNIKSLLCDLYDIYNIKDKTFDLFSPIIPENIDLERINTDPSKLQQIITNLLNNAFKFTEKGYVKFGCTVENDFIKFFVEDTGMGIAQNQLQFVFNRFAQTKRGASPILGGTGLGLSICKGHVELLGGSIWVESKIYKGSIFYFTVPLNTSKKERKISESKKSIKPIELLSGSILVAEDVRVNYLLIEAILQRTNCKLIYVENGLQAVEKCNGDIDLVLMDIKMPVMDGLEAAKNIRKKYPNLPIIAQTSYALEEDKHKFLEVGFDNYISKPIDEKSLLSIVSRYLQAKI